jgi:hypothetical protein
MLPFDATILASDSQESNPLYIQPLKERFYILTKLGHDACAYFAEQDRQPPAPPAPKIPTLSQLMNRSGIKGLELTLIQLGEAYQVKHGHPWIYQGATIRRDRLVYFFDVDVTPYFMGAYSNAVRHMLDYVQTGTPNHAMRRAR